MTRNNHTRFRNPLLALFFVIGFTAMASTDQYSALAYSESTGDFGVGQSSVSFRDSFDEAMKICGKDDCFVRVSIQNGCLAFARSSDWKALGFAGRKSLAHSVDKALFLCKRPWPNDCKIVFSFCSEGAGIQ